MSEQETTAVEVEPSIPTYDVAAIINNFEVLMRIIDGAGGRFGLKDDEKRNLATVKTNLARFRTKYFSKG